MSRRSDSGGLPDAPSHGSDIRDLPDALSNREELARRLAGKRPAVFLDYDGTLTPIVDRPEDALISAGMRKVVRALAKRCPVCVVSGRDRAVVQELMGIDDLVVAGSHGFDIWTPQGGTVEHEAASGFDGLFEEVRTRLSEYTTGIDGIGIESKKVSVAVHFRLVWEPDRRRVREAVDALVADHPEELKVVPGKMVYEIQPNVAWNKGKAVLHLLDSLGLDDDDVMPLYLGDDVTDEDAFVALSGRGIGIFVGSAEDPEVAGRRTAASYALASTREVQRFLHTLARGS
jgi:trehalose 6-phosphate phosphatase